MESRRLSKTRTTRGIITRLPTRLRCVVLCFSSVAALSISPTLSQDHLLPVFHFRQLTMGEGLPSFEIRTTVVQDRQGFRWIGTVNGLARFDGYGCKVYRNDVNDGHSISSNAVQSLLLDGNGRLWVGTWDGGLNLYDARHDNFVAFRPRSNDSTWIAPAPITAIHEDPSGNLWLMSYRGMVEFVDLSAVRDETDADSIAARIKVRVIHASPTEESPTWIGDWDAQNILVATPRGLHTVDRRTLQASPLSLPPARGIDLDTTRISDFCWESRDRLWIGTHSHGLYLLDRAKWSLDGYPGTSRDGAPEPTDQITEISFDNNGRLWVGTVGGLYLFDPARGKYLNYMMLDVERPHDVYYMNVDAAGMFWISTRGMGVYYLPSRSLRMPHYALGGEGGRPLAMETVHDNGDGTYWISSEGKAVQIELATLNVLRTVDVFKGRKPTYGRAGVFDSYRAPSGVIWYGTWGLGLYRFDPVTGSVRNFRSSDQLADSEHRDDICWGLLGFGDDSLLIAAYTDGLQRFDMRTHSFVNRAVGGGPSPRNIRDIMRDASGNLWISDEALGLRRIDHVTGEIESFSPDLQDTTTISHTRVAGTFQDPRGDVWVGAVMLNQWNPERGTFRRHPNPAFPTAVFVVPLGSDAAGRVWNYYFGSGLGIIDPPTGAFGNYDPIDGVNSGNLNAMAVLPDDRVMLLGSRGMNLIQIDSLPPVPPPPLAITRMTVNDSLSVSGSDLSGDHVLEFSPHQDVVEFEFAAIDPGAGHLIDYAFRLEGHEERWTPATQRRFVRYSGLPPGAYRFRVRATSLRGSWPAQELSIPFTVATPWWKTWWLRLLAAGVIIALVGYFFRREIDRLQRENLMRQEFSRRQIEIQEEGRRRLAGELHDGLGQDLLVMNNELQQFIQQNAGTSGELQHVASLLKESIDGVREISANLHPHLLDRLGFCEAVKAMAERVSHASGIAVAHACDDIDHLLAKDAELHLYRILQESLSNAARHAHAKHVRLEVKRGPGAITVTISDDGLGFDTRTVSDGQRGRDPKTRLRHFGLSNMQERARMIGGSFRIESSPGSGTTILVIIPYG